MYKGGGGNNDWSCIASGKCNSPAPGLAPADCYLQDTSNSLET